MSRHEKIQRYDPCTCGFNLTMRPNDNGEAVYWDDVKDRIMPDEWPGVYPDTDNGDTWYFIDSDDEVYPVVIFNEYPLSFLHPISGTKVRVKYTKPEQWGPRVPMVRP